MGVQFLLPTGQADFTLINKQNEDGIPYEGRWFNHETNIVNIALFSLQLQRFCNAILAFVHRLY